MKPALAPAPSRTSTGGIPPCASVYGCRCWVKCCSSSCWAAGWAFADSSELKKESAAQYLCSSLLLAGRSIISIRRSICGRSGVPFLQGRLLLQQVCHAAQADAKGGKVMQHGAGGRGQDAQSPRRMRAELKLSTGFSPYKTDSVLAMLAGSTPGA